MKEVYYNRGLKALNRTNSNEARRFEIKVDYKQRELGANRWNIEKLERQLKELQVGKKYGRFFSSQERIYSKDPTAYYDSTYSSTLKEEKDLKERIAMLEYKLENKIPNDEIIATNYIEDKPLKEDIVNSYSEISTDNKVNYWEEQKNTNSTRKKYFENTGEKIEALEIPSR